MNSEVRLGIIYATLSSFGLAMLFPYIWPYATEVLMLPIIISGVLLFSYYFIETISRIPVGSFGNHLNHSFIILLGSLAFGVTSIFYLTHTYAWQLLFGGQILLGFAVSVTWVTIPDYMTRADASLPIYTFAVGLGFLGGTAVGGVLTDLIGIQNMFYIFSFISIFLIFIAFLLKKEATGTFNPLKNIYRESSMDLDFSNVSKISKNSFKEAYGLFRDSLAIKIVGLVSFVMFMTFGIGTSMVPIYLEGIGISSTFIGIILATRMTCSTLIRLGTNKILRFGRKALVLMAGTAVVGLSIFFFSLTEALPLLIMLSVFWGLGDGLYLPVVFSLISDSTSDADRGVGMGIRGTMGTLGSAAGSLVFFTIGEVVSVRLALTVFGLFVLVFSLCVLSYWELEKG